MDEKRWMTINFTDGTEKHCDFQVQQLDFVTLGDLIEKSIESNKLIMEVDGAMNVFPYANITYIRVSPDPEILPDITVKGVQLAD